jgi:ParB/RepB/Spo0J family partition protein
MNSGRTYVNGDVYTLDMDEIRLDPNQPKEHYNEDVVIEKLTRAIKDHLFFQPVFFKLDDDGKPVLILGGRRYTAARRAGLKTIPGVYCDGRLCEVSVVSNLMLGDLTPVEEAEALRQALAMRYTIDQLALALGRPPDAIREALTLNRLPVEVLDECRRDPEYERQELLRIARTRDEEEMRKLFCDYRRRLLRRPGLRSRRRAQEKFGRGLGTGRRRRRRGQGAAGHPIHVGQGAAKQTSGQRLKLWGFATLKRMGLVSLAGRPFGASRLFSLARSLAGPSPLAREGWPGWGEGCPCIAEGAQ